MNSTSNSQQDNSTCRTYSWIAAIVAGVVVFLLAWKLLTWGFFPSLFVGVVVFLILGYALIHWFCSQATSVSSDSSTVAAAVAASSAAQSRTEPVAAPSVAPTPVPAAVFQNLQRHQHPSPLHRSRHKLPNRRLRSLRRPNLPLPNQQCLNLPRPKPVLPDHGAEKRMI